MKPNFALTLSAEGIRLLQRAPSGWLLVGDADFADAELTRVMADLRNKAERLSPSKVHTKLVLPNDQIKYMTVRSAATSEEEAETEAAAALEGATPYSLSELAFDWSLDDGQLFLAAVARETLAEAEGFAAEHGFNPMSFVALPEQNDFPGEPFFGLTRAARELLDPTQNVARDLQPLQVIGKADIPDPELAPEPDPAPVPEAPMLLDANARQDDPDDEAPAPDGAAPVMAFSSVRTTGAPPDQPPAPTAPQPSKTEGAIESVTSPSIPPAPPEGEATATTGFQSSRKPPAPAATTAEATPKAKPKPQKIATPKPKPTPKPKSVDPTADQDEQQRLTLFGARKPAAKMPMIGGKPRHMGLALTVVLLMFLAIAAIWASFLSPGGIAGLFGSNPEQIEMDVASGTEDPNAATAEELAEAQDVEPAGAADPALTEGQAVLLPVTPDLITPEEAERRYIATGIWQVAPEQPQVPDASGDADVYLASLDPQVRAVDAIALPDISLQHDGPPNETLNPTAAGTTFDVDQRGLVRATPEGALTPEGITVYAGKPSSVPDKLPERRGDGLNPAELERIAQVRPRARPGDLKETTERGQLGGRTLSELAALRPKARPAWITPQVEGAPTPQAVALSLRPKTRPENFAQLVARTQKVETQVAAAAPSIPSSASVARQATVKNALNLKKLNLIGVNGKGGDRRALVRTQNGRYKTVKIGDRLDGGKVSSITETELRYTKGGKSVVLKMPRG